MTWESRKGDSVFIVIRRWGFYVGQGLHGLNFHSVPKENAPGFLIRLPRCGAEEKGGGGPWKVSTVKHQKWSQTIIRIEDLKISCSLIIKCLIYHLSYFPRMFYNKKTILAREKFVCDFRNFKDWEKGKYLRQYQVVKKYHAKGTFKLAPSEDALPNS